MAYDLLRKMNKMQLTTYLFLNSSVHFKENSCKVILSSFCVNANHQY